MTAPQHDVRIRIFFSSPGDVQEEREVAQDVVQELQRLEGEELGVNLVYRGWETDTYPEIGRPQGVINQQIGDYEIFVGVFWNRYGSPTGEAESGTVEEFENALDNRDEDGIPAVLFYFCQRPASLEEIEELDQKISVVQFRKEYGEKAGLYETYEGIDEFEEKLRHGLLETIRDVRNRLIDHAEAVPAEVEEPAAAVSGEPDGAATIEDFLDDALSAVETDFGDFADNFCRVHEDAEIEIIREESALSGQLQIDGQTRNGCKVRKRRTDRDSALIYTSGAVAASDVSRGSIFASAKVVAPNGRLGFRVESEDPNRPTGHIDAHALAHYLWSLFVKPVESMLGVAHAQ